MAPKAELVMGWACLYNTEQYKNKYNQHESVHDTCKLRIDRVLQSEYIGICGKSKGLWL